MYPAEHVLVAVGPVVGYALWRNHRLPGGGLLLVVLAASLLPDLVDKPLAWSFGVIPSGRMIAHSFVLAVPLVLFVLLLAHRQERLGYGLGFGWGYLLHLAADFSPVLVLGADYYFFPNMFWPIAAANPDPDPGFGQHLPTLGLVTFLEVAVLALLVGYVVVEVWQWRAERPRLP